MTFVLSEINHHRIIMASDSSETHSVSGRESFIEVDKTLYFQKLNLGISTWGEARVGSLDINEWLRTTVQEFVNCKNSAANQALAAVTSFLAKRLDREFNFNGVATNHSIRMGLHIAGYNSPDEGAAPGICHAFIERGFRNFEAQQTVLSLPKHIPAFHLRNGMYEEFAIMWPALSGIDAAFRNLIALRHQNIVKPHSDPVRVQAEWLGNWVRQMCLVIKTAGLPEYIGKAVKILTFDHKGNVRWFRLPEMENLKEA